MEHGKLITIEGIDGVGKTTCATRLCERLNLDGKKYKYVHRKEIATTNEYIKLHMECLYSIMWGKGKIFSQAPNIEYNGLTREHWRHLMLAWYSAFEQHVIFPQLNEGVSLIMDGYIYKEIVKAIYSSGDFETEKEFDFLYKPDCVVYLDASPEDCIRDDSDTNRIESGMFVGMKSDFVKHQNKMKKIYDRLAEEKKWLIVNRNKDVETTCDDIMKAVNYLK